MYETFQDAIRENLTPAAVAAIACQLRSIDIPSNREVEGEVNVLAKVLIAMLGADEYSRLVEDELGW
ncbi:MAG: hypothetical protein WBC44_02930 [Planctomycetaceae bacterium]